MEKVAIVLVNWNAIADTLECLSSLLRLTYPLIEIIVVDNASAEGEAEAIKRAFPQAYMERSPINLGYTGGNNLGLQLALKRGASFVLCLNNDTTVEPDCVEPLIEALRADSEAGLVTPSIYAYHDRDLLLGCGCALRPHYDGGVNLVKLPDNDPFEVEYVEGCAMFMRREVAELTDGFDDRFFAYFEDADLCLRAKAKGWKCLAVPASRIYHKVVRGSSGAFSPASFFYGGRNAWLLVSSHGTRWEKLSFPFRRIMAVARSVGYSLLITKTREDDDHKRLAHERCIAFTLGSTAGALRLFGNRKKGPWRDIERIADPCLRILLFAMRPLSFLIPKKKKQA